MGASVTAGRTVRLLALAGMLLVLWVAFTAQEASAAPAPRALGSSGVPSPNSASTVRVLTPVNADGRDPLRSDVATLGTVAPARGITPQQPRKPSGAVADGATKSTVPQWNSATPETSRSVRHATSARGGVHEAAATTTRAVQLASGAVNGLLVDVGTAASRIGLDAVTEPVVSAARPAAAAVVARATRAVTGVADTVESAPLPVLDVPLVPDGEYPDQVTLFPPLQAPEPAVSPPGLVGDDAAGPLAHESGPVDDASTRDRRSGAFTGAVGPSATGWAQDTRPLASSGLGMATSMSDGGHLAFPSTPGPPGSPGALGSSTAAGAGSSAPGGGSAADTADAIGLPTLLNSLVSPDQRADFSHRQPLPAFSPE